MQRKRFPPEVLTPQEVGGLLGACDGDDWISVRNRALLAVLYRSGVRIAEALALQPKDVDLDAGAIRVLHAKGGRSRTVGIDPGGARVVAEWMDRRAAIGMPRVAPVFCCASGRALGTGYARRLLASLGARAGIEKRVHPHGLRHTHAAELRAEGVDIGIISRQLGHRSIATTARYLDHIAPMAVVDAMRRREW